jgi:hypothetical protein
MLAQRPLRATVLFHAAVMSTLLQLTPELRPRNGNNVFVFALPE